jgi:iron complex outermembrane recepter protein
MRALSSVSARLSASLLAGTALFAFAGPAAAQEQAPGAAPVDTGAAAAPSDETIVVTGSRIARRDYESDSPIVTLSQDALERRSKSCRSSLPARTRRPARPISSPILPQAPA